jgi:hypothetical protein
MDFFYNNHYGQFEKNGGAMAFCGGLKWQIFSFLP